MKLANLKKVLKEKHITQKQLSQALNISPKTLNGYISDKKTNQPPIEIVIDISKYLGVSIETLLGLNSSAKQISNSDLKRLKELHEEETRILSKYF